MKYKVYLKVISVILIFTLILQTVPIAISAQTVAETIEAAEAEAAYVIGEDKTLREESVKYFRMSDGSFTAVSYASPVHYLDGDGEYKDIDNTLTFTNTGYENKDNPFNVMLPENSDGEVSVESDGKKISFKLAEAKKVKSKVKEKKEKTEKEIEKEAEKAKTKKEKAKIINDHKYTLKNYSSGITYEGVSDDVDISYDIYGTSLKESIVLNKKNAKSSYTYIFTYDGFEAILNEDNSVSFMDGEAEYFRLAAPYMFDSADVYSSDIEVKLTKTETGCTYELIPSKEWLRDKERVYPVTIDPTVQPKLNATEIKDATVMFTNYNSTMENWAKNFGDAQAFDYLTIGKYPNSSNTVEVGIAIYAAIPNSIPDTARITGASLQLGLRNISDQVQGENVRIEAYKIKGDWNTSNINEDNILFNNARTGVSAIPNTEQESIDFTYLSRGIYEYYDFNITRAAQSWHHGEANYGIMLRMDSSSIQKGCLAAFYSSDYNVGGVTNRPLFVFNYRDTSGLEDYWSYHSAAAGDAGTGYVNDFGGNLTFIRNDTSYVNERYNVSLAHVYNTNIANALKETDKQPYGNGWRMNIGEFGSETIENQNYYYYIDSDGTKHYFYNDNGTYKDEDGLGLVYSSVSGTYPKKITTKNHETMLFDSNGKLRRITDSNSNSVDFTYDTNGLTLVEIGGEDIFTLTYTNGKLSSVKNNKTNRTTNYTYDSAGNLIAVSESWVTGHINEYTYSGNLLTSATDSTGYRLSYGYSNTGSTNTINRVSSVSESALDGENRVNGQTLRFAYYSGNQTVIEDCGIDGDIASTADNNKMTYQFDTYGQSVSCYDEEGRGSTFKYENGESAQHRLSLSAASHPYVYGNGEEGEFKDAGMDSGNTHWYTAGWGDYYSSIEYDYYGNVYAHLSSGSSSSYAYVSQSVELDKGKYIATAYFKPLTADTVAWLSMSHGYESHYGDYYGDPVELIPDGNGGYEWVKSTFEFEVRVDYASVVIYAQTNNEDALSAVYVDNIEVRPVEYSSKENYVKNGRFGDVYSSQWVTDTSIPPATVINRSNVADEALRSSHTMKIDACPQYPEAESYIYQNVNVSGKEGDVYLLSGWAKAASRFGDESEFRLSAMVNYSDGTDKTTYLDFNKNVVDWQFASAAVLTDDGKENTNLTYTSITVKIEYMYQANAGYFDDIQLIRDDAVSYVYDDDGNVISAKTAVTNSQYKYDGNSRLTSAIDTTGRNFKYTYDDNHNMTSAVSDAATVIRYEYNSFGQATKSVTYANTQHQIPEDGGIYYIFLRSTGWYMDSRNIDSEETVIHDRYDGTPNNYLQEFTVTKQSDGYYTLCNNGLFVTATSDEEGTVLKYEDAATADGAHFKFVKVENGGYRIVSKLNDEMCISNVEEERTYSSALILSETNEDSDEQVWYFESAELKDIKPVIKDKAIYAIRGFDYGRYFAPVALTAGSKVQAVTGEDNSGKFFIEKYANTDYYYIKVVDTNLALSYNINAEDGYEAITLEQSVDGSEAQLFSINVHEEDIIDRADRYSISINPKLNSSEYVYAWISDYVHADTYHGHFGCYLFFEEVLYSSSSAVYNDDGTELVSTTDNASGLTTTYEYDNIGRVSSTEVGTRITSNQYDNRDRVTKVTSGDTYVGYTYEDNRLKNISVDGAQTYIFGYDAFGNNTSISVGNTPLAQYSYIGNTGLMSGMTYGNNDSIAYTYDDDYRVIQTVYTDKNSLGSILGSKTVDYEYDLFGNLYRFTDGFTGNTTTYNYDLLGRITRINKTGGLNRSITYDAFDRINGFTLSVLGKNIHSSVAYGDFGQVNSFTNTIGDREDKISYTYDAFYRQTKRKIEAINKTSEYTYLKGANGQDTVLVETLNNGKDTYKYTYDVYGNITSVAKNGTVVESYIYDELNQLTQATIGTDVYTYTYDDRGNILSVRKGENSYVTYSYSDSNWKDLLTSYNGTTITYDNIGNPNNWRNNMSFDWEYGRRLKGVTKGSDSISYTYDADGLRTGKTVNGVTTEYYWLDGVLQGQKTGNEHIIFLYDENGTAYGMLIDNNGTQSYYYYLFNLQGDIVGIMDSTGATVVEYTYDPWGNWKSISGDVELANKNPLRYRGYYYDTETGFYYLQSRYYDPVVQRFINADSLMAGVNASVQGYNLFAYCFNNPINAMDSEGNWPKWAKNAYNKVKDAFKKIVNTIKNHGTVKHDVPLYYQGNTNLCWAYSQLMVEDYDLGIERTPIEASDAAKEISKNINGATNWNVEGYPDNMTLIPSTSPLAMYTALKYTGPLYAFYEGQNDKKGSGHYIVVTGIDLEKGLIYTNNPWGYSGSQTYDEFHDAFLRGNNSSWELSAIYLSY